MDIFKRRVLTCSKGIIDLNSGEFCSEITPNQVGWNIESPQHFEESQAEFKPFANLFEKNLAKKSEKELIIGRALIS